MILHNVLKQADYDALKEQMLGEFFPWYWNNYINEPDEAIGGFQLIHTFYAYEKPQSSALHIVQNILNAFTEKTGLRIKTIYRIKANLNPRDSSQHLNVEDLKHTDMDDDKWVSLLYYVNDSDGATVFEDEEVLPKGNSLVMFKSNSRHAGKCPVIHKRKVVINFVVELR